MGRRLVERWHQQRVTNRTGIRSQQAPDPGYCLVEVVESAERHEAYPPTFWCLRIDVVEIAETGRILEVTEQRQTVPPLGLGVLRTRRCCGAGHLATQGGNGGKRAGTKYRTTGQRQRKPPANQALRRAEQLSLILVHQRLTSADMRDQQYSTYICAAAKKNVGKTRGPGCTRQKRDTKKGIASGLPGQPTARSEEHTSE